MRRLDSATHQCEDLTVRHTPAFGHPSPRGDGLPRHTYCQGICQGVVNALSKSRCRAIPSRRGVAEGRGVSHSQAQIAIHAPSNPNNNPPPFKPFKPSNPQTLQLKQQLTNPPTQTTPLHPSNPKTLQPSNPPPYDLHSRSLTSCRPFNSRTQVL